MAHLKKELTLVHANYGVWIRQLFATGMYDTLTNGWDLKNLINNVLNFKIIFRSIPTISDYLLVKSLIQNQFNEIKQKHQTCIFITYLS